MHLSLQHFALNEGADCLTFTQHGVSRLLQQTSGPLLLLHCQQASASEPGAS